MSEETISTSVPPLPIGRYDNTTVVRIRSSGGRYVFVRTKDGKVYSASNYGHPTRLDRGYGMNGNVRRAYCKFAGISLDDLQAAIQREREAQARDAAKQQVEDLREMAAELGYKLVKGRKNG